MSEELKDANTRVEEATEAAANALTALSISSQGHEDDDDDSFEIPQRFTKSGRKRAVPFPLKLMKVLSNKKFNDIITWTPSGKSFTILQPKVFVADILPEHFKSAKYSSFTRKLHRWGFMRHYRGEESGAFYHKDFQRDRLDLVEQMTCKSETAPKAVAAIAKKPPAVANLPMVQKQAPPVSLAQISVAAPMMRSQPPVDIQSLQAPQAAAVATHLDAAIEAEVTRRLHERINQAALSRMFMQQQLNSPVIPLALRAQLLEMQQKKLNSLAGPLIPLAMPARNSTGMGDIQRNVQGAKTA